MKLQGEMPAALLLAAALMFSGCAISIGKSHTDKGPRPTLGQELVDLKTALEEGAVSEEEYLKQKQKLLDR